MVKEPSYHPMLAENFNWIKLDKTKLAQLYLSFLFAIPWKSRRPWNGKTWTRKEKHQLLSMMQKKEEQYIEKTSLRSSKSWVSCSSFNSSGGH